MLIILEGVFYSTQSRQEKYSRDLVYTNNLANLLRYDCIQHDFGVY